MTRLTTKVEVRKCVAQKSLTSKGSQRNVNSKKDYSCTGLCSKDGCNCARREIINAYSFHSENCQNSPLC